MPIIINLAVCVFSYSYKSTSHFNFCNSSWAQKDAESVFRSYRDICCCFRLTTPNVYVWNALYGHTQMQWGPLWWHCRNLKEAPYHV